MKADYHVDAKRIGPMTKVVKRRRLSRGLKMFSLIYGYDPPRDEDGDLGLMNWIRMCSWYIKSGAMMPSTLRVFATGWREEVNLPAQYEWTVEYDERLRRAFSDSLAAHVKERRARLGSEDPQRIYKKMMRDKAKRQEFLRRELAKEAIREHRCPLCREKAEGDLTEVRRQGRHLLPDCCGYGGLYTYVLPPGRKSYYRMLMTWDEWVTFNVKC